MSNTQSSSLAMNPSHPGSSTSSVLEAIYAGRERPVRSQNATASQLRKPKAAGPDAVWGQFNNYRSNGLAGSIVVHILLLGGLLGFATLGHPVVEQVRPRQTVTLIAPSPDSYALPVAKTVVSGGGGGGERSPLREIKGKLPKTALQQITPPQIVLRNEHSKLAVEPTVVVPPQVRLADNHMPTLGNPSAAVLPSAPPSNGAGSGGGIGSGLGGGVGVGHGSGVGAGSGGGIGGGVYKVGGGISAPQPLSTPDPEYTEEARNAKAQGTCVLWMIVDSNGNPRDIRVVKGLGFGLDAKAIAAVKQWHFQPAKKDGNPVDVQISVEVGFRLY